MQVSGNNRYPTSVQEQNSQTKARKQNIIRKLDIGGRTVEVVETILTDECIETDFLELENKHLRVNHTEVGSKLAIKWCFPESLVDTILHHHYPENGTQNPKLTHMVYIADFLMARFHAGLELEHLNTDRLSSQLEKIGLSVSQFH